MTSDCRSTPFQNSSLPSQRRIVIGDIHGHYQGLVQLLEWIAPGEGDAVYCLGDLIDRGAESKQVIDLIRQSGYTTLLGNHEQMLIDAFPEDQVCMSDLQVWLYSGGHATFSNYDANLEALLEDVRWLREQPYQVDLGDAWLVHAGINPRLALEEQTIEDVCWIRESFHTMPKPYFKDKLIITGHTITFTFPGVEPGELVQGNGWLDIDTGAYHRKSGWLTALDWDQRHVYQVNVYTSELRERPLEKMVKHVKPEQLIKPHLTFAQVA